jgi:hypothetical protein
MFPPAPVDVQRVRVVGFIIVLTCPLDVKATGVSIAGTVVEPYFE